MHFDEEHVPRVNCGVTNGKEAMVKLPSSMRESAFTKNMREIQQKTR